MKEVEKTRKKHHCIKFVKKKLEKTSTTFVTKTMDNGTVMELIDKAKFEKEIIAENLKKYHQSEASCPLFHPPLYKEICSLDDGPACASILKGAYKAPDDTT